VEARYLLGRDSLLDVGPGGLWLRQRTEDGTAAIFAESVAAESITLDGVVVFLYGPGDLYEGRVDAAEAVLRDGHWEIHDAWITEPGQPSERLEENWQLPTDLTPARIQDSFAPPETLSFWELPAFISTLEATGFSALRHRLHLQSLLAQPALMAAMVLFGALFTLRQARRGGTLAMVVGGVLTGFVLFVLNDVVTALGLAETIPVPLAAWTPAAISLAVATSGLFYLEDG
jgi:lipopolysaccharide export system permease protein